MSKGKFYAGDFRLGYCAFCKHWYDPSNNAIKPRNPRFNQWEFDDQCRKMCMKKNLEMNANAFCGWYECKIDLQ